jgi:hypothetical protein
MPSVSQGTEVLAAANPRPPPKDLFSLGKKGERKCKQTVSLSMTLDRHHGSPDSP